MCVTFEGAVCLCHCDPCDLLSGCMQGGNALNGSKAQVSCPYQVITANEYGGVGLSVDFQRTKDGVRR